MNNSCCKINSCTNPFCQPRETCDETCIAKPVTYNNAKQEVTLIIPYFVFKNFTQEQCENSGAAAFYQIWKGFRKVKK